MKPKLIVFASGTATSGGSGFENLVEATKTGVLDAEIVAVVSNNEHGGVAERAKKLGIPFIYFAGPFDATHYQEVVAKALGAEPAPLEGAASLMGWVALSGWLKLVHGLDAQKTFNIHPAPLSIAHGQFGGKKMYGHNLHQEIAQALERGEIASSAVTMHFVTEEYDKGPVFFEKEVPLKKGMTADEVQKAVNVVEHEWQPKITNMVVHGEISWDGKDSASLKVPEGYKYLPRK